MTLCPWILLDSSPDIAGTLKDFWGKPKVSACWHLSFWWRFSKKRGVTLELCFMKNNRWVNRGFQSESRTQGDQNPNHLVEGDRIEQWKDELSDMLYFINKTSGKRYVSYIYLTRRNPLRMIHFAYKAVWSVIDHTVNLMVQFAAFILALRLDFVFIQNEWKHRKQILTINLLLVKHFVILCFFL